MLKATKADLYGMSHVIPKKQGLNEKQSTQGKKGKKAMKAVK